MINTNRNSKTIIIIVETMLAIIGFLVVFPLILLLITSFKQGADLYNPFFMQNFTDFTNYVTVFKKQNIPLAAINTAIICIATIGLNIIVSSTAGYAISRGNGRFFQIMFIFFVFGLIIPLQASMVITYKIGAILHLINTRTFLVLLYVAGGCAYGIMLYSGFTKSVPRELEEAASLDGYGIYGTFSHIVFPLLRPATATLFVTTIFWYWNDFQGPLIYLNDARSSTIMYTLFTFQMDQRSTDWGPIFALCTISVFPMIVLFMLAQKNLLAGLTAGAVKG